ncbi:hypothetical protein [Alteribacillus bidgolensis]|uniref:Uncharacterized protein n=1 Tax=Alteribacillus bidgolensis TaxID=930129 RepID=A0A1G8RGU1_9BACI|nr:hypothetical protein [Alteribacillus bidgolensis]SDJ16172.1 hypothetical protein SAMN05216352_12725 [Alteribacillus bidgolensis]
MGDLIFTFSYGSALILIGLFSKYMLNKLNSSEIKEKKELRYHEEEQKPSMK